MCGFSELDAAGGYTKIWKKWRSETFGKTLTTWLNESPTRCKRTEESYEKPGVPIFSAELAEGYWIPRRRNECWAGCRSGCNCGCRNSIDDIAREHACLSNVTASQSRFGALALPLNGFFAWPLTTLAGSATLDPSTSAFESRKLCRRAEIQNLIIFSKTFLISYLRLWEF